MGHLNLGKSILKQVQCRQGPGVTELITADDTFYHHCND